MKKTKDEIRKAILEKYADRETLTLAEQVEILSMVNITDLGGKLEDFWSLSSSPVINEYCQVRAKNPALICHECFSLASMNYKAGLRKGLEYNTTVFSRWLFDEKALVTIAIPNVTGYDRIESHGDVRNVVHARNYIRFIKAHEWIKFGVWSKNIAFYAKAFEYESKPDNMTFIASSPFYNKAMQVPERFRWFVDHVFTVYRKQYATENNIDINCGARSCKTCLKCYKKDTDYYIKEMLKQDATKKENRPILVGEVKWTHNPDKTITLVFHDITNDRVTTKHYKTERGAKAAETRFNNQLAMNRL